MLGDWILELVSAELAETMAIKEALMAIGRTRLSISKSHLALDRT